MSVQLIIYPQSYLGVVDPISASSMEFVVDGIDFTNVDAATSTGFAAVPAPPTVLTATPPTIPNTWYRWRYPDAPPVDAPNYPEEFSGGLSLMGKVGPMTYSGVYQKITNLVIGSSYDIVIKTQTPAPSPKGRLAAMLYNGTTILSGVATNVMTLITGADLTGTFIANATELTLFLQYRPSGASESSDIIESISITESTPTGTAGYLGNGQEICDLYEDEDIPLTLSVDDFKNIAEQVQSYSKAFKLPGTKHNNKIFNALYEITRTTQNTIEFNPYVKTKCVLKQDGLLLFEGYLKMIDIQEKGGEISYNINLYSEVVALVDILGDRTFSDLDFTELSHDYNRTQIQYSWNDLGGGTGITYINPSTSGFRTSHNTVKYPFVDWNHQWVLGGTGGSPDAAPNMPELTSLEQAFRPFINVKYCIERIFDATPFTFTSAFFDTGEFEDLFMDFNWGANDSSTEPSSTGFTDTTTDIYSTTSYANYHLDNPNTFSADLGYNDVNHRFVAPNDNTQYNLEVLLSFKYVGGGTGMSARIAHKNSAGIIINTYQLYYDDSTLYPLYNVSQNVNLQQNDTLQVEWKSDTAGTYLQFPHINRYIIASVGSGLATTNTLLQNLRGGLGQWDFLKGIMTMFNLVSIPDTSDPNNIVIEPWVDVFGKTDAASGTSLAEREIQLDWTNKIDVSEMKLTPLTDLNKKTIFKFVEDDDDWAASYYKTQAGGWLYGEERMDSASFAGNGLPTLLEGEEEIIAEPFAATVIKALDGQFTELVVPSIYSYNPDDGTSEGFDNSPRIMYNNRKKVMGSTTYFIPEQNGVSSENADTFLQFSHLTTIPSGAGVRDFLFASKQLFPGVGTPPVDNLVSLYWLPYLAELYNPDTRTMTIKVNLNAGDISTFDFSYTVYVKNREFRVNKIDYKPNDLATVEFILIP
tara:strand:+ start:3134 stop:5902 length:2769 start_codon:yes stop_codon:yes gene_type:complete